ncbi:hypothetical protein [Phaeovulum sp. NW3]|uniref:hypothetical protein n=1 Tax=Phaeovulum sp. NW3 TaxID=2934933 RepID=UPI00201FD8E3|nr:hypothetical protein [Phaeovulum sp. NW3]MCL7463819.1 hypothetical protein [Phaeovulum sp. NW3]
MVPIALAGCGLGPESVWASDEAVEKASYSTGLPPSVTLYTVIGTRTGEGGHSALMIDGRERIMFDPAGSWRHPWIPERNDVHYGITERMRKFYIDYHARETWFVREQTVPVSLEVAELLRARAEANGAVGKMLCATSSASILRGAPGFESIPGTFSPLRLSRAFGNLPGVTSKDHYDGDPANNSGVLMIQAQQPARVPDEAFN